jgi:hypothetical protein
MKIEITGQDAQQATEELLAIEGVEGSYETIEEVEREGTLVTIATIVGIVSGTITIAESIHRWNQKYQKSLHNPTAPRIERVLIVGKNKRLLLLQDTTLDQIKELLETEE